MLKDYFYQYMLKENVSVGTFRVSYNFVWRGSLLTKTLTTPA